MTSLPLIVLRMKFICITLTSRLQDSHSPGAFCYPHLLIRPCYTLGTTTDVFLQITTSLNLRTYDIPCPKPPQPPRSVRKPTYEVDIRNRKCFQVDLLLHSPPGKVTRPIPRMLLSTWVMVGLCNEVIILPGLWVQESCVLRRGYSRWALRCSSLSVYNSLWDLSMRCLLRRLGWGKAAKMASAGVCCKPLDFGCSRCPRGTNIRLEVYLFTLYRIV